MHKKFILAFIFVMLTSMNTHAATLSASVDKTTIPLGEAFTLTINADENLNESPDLNVLRKNFKVYSTSVSRQNYIINGQSEASVTWKIGLVALNEGNQEIPSIPVGKDKTPAVKINVIGASSAISNDSALVSEPSAQNEQVATSAKYGIRAFIENNEKPHYVQQQITYNVVISDDGSLTGGEPVFDANEAGNWIIRSLGQPQSTTKTIEGKKIRETTFRYALFAQKSGDLTIPQVWFNGYALQPNRANNTDIFNQDIFNFTIKMPAMFGMEKPVSLRVPAKKINILPIPADYPGTWWLPAEKVVLNAKWSDKVPQFKAGEAFSREITLQAVGVTESQLPDIKFPQTVDFRQYPEKPIRQSGSVNGLPAAEMKVINVYIPEKSGRLTLPAITVDWYNTQTGTFERATIPSEEIDVVPNPQLVNFSDNTNHNADIAKNTTSSTERPIAKDNMQQIKPEEKSVVATQNTFFYIILVAVFAAGMLVSWILFRHRPVAGKPQCEMRQYPEYLIKKAYQNDFRSLRDGLVSWATGFYPEHQINNLKDVAQAAENPQFARQIDIILAKLYNPQDESLWNPKIFSDILKDLVKNKNKTAKEKLPLPPLYG